MSRSALLLMVLLPLSASAEQPNPKAHDVLRDVRAQLEDVDALIDDADSRAVQRELHKKLDHIDGELERLDALLRTGGAGRIAMDAVDHGVDVHVGPGGMHVSVDGPHASVPELPAADPVPAACSAQEFDSIRAAVEDEDFSDSKMRVLGSAASGRWFTSAQAARLMDAFDFGSDKVEAGAALFPRVVDPENWYVVYDALEFDSDKDKLKARVGR